MEIEYKRLTEKELDTFIDMRIHQLREEGAKEDIDLVPALRDYYNRHMLEGTFISWLAMDGEQIIGTSGMSYVEKPPYFGCPSGKMGLLSSMYTNPAYRRKGIARELYAVQTLVSLTGIVFMTIIEPMVQLTTDNSIVYVIKTRSERNDCCISERNRKHETLSGIVASNNAGTL